MRHLIIGGAGFIGCNLAEHLIKKGEEVVIFDNLSRKGTHLNLEYLKSLDSRLKVIKGDIRYDQEKLVKEIARVNVVYHLAAQVAVTTSVLNPREDFEINALGTFNVLETIRKTKNKPIMLYSSTNKVYGGIENAEIIIKNNRYQYQNMPHGIPETQNLDFHSPYGCSKGAADQYVRDYARIYNLPTIVFRQSCIYGPHQFGAEDQGWIAWFTIATTFSKPITIYGDGRQVRDILYVSDLIKAYEMAITNIKKTKGQIYNIGGGTTFTLSLLELVEYLKKLFGRPIKYSLSKWRPGDQLVYISDIRKAEKDFGWKPKVGAQQGIRALFDWVKDNKIILKEYI